MKDFEGVLKSALELDLQYGHRPPRTPRQTDKQASVLILWCEGRLREQGPASGEPHVLLIQRSDHVETHQGQFAFPGGKVEPSDPDPQFAALREAEEEVGISPESVKVLGRLPSLFTVSSRFLVQPFVAWTGVPIQDLNLIPDPREVSRVFWVPVTVFLQPEVRQTEELQVNRSPVQLPYFQLPEGKVWGATAVMMDHLLLRLKTVGFG